MPEETPGYLTKPLDLLESLICNSATFQEVVGAANADEAGDHVFWDEAFAQDVRPWAIISDGERTSTKTSTTGWYDESELLVLFEFPSAFDGGHQTNAGPRSFRVLIERIEAEMKAANNANPSSTLSFRDIRGPKIIPPNPKESDGEKFYGAFIVVNHEGDGSA